MNYCPQCGAELTTRMLQGVVRAACATCHFVHWDNPVPVVAALVEFDGNIVLARNAHWPRGVFSVVTGFLEKGETPDAAVVREVGEELGAAGTIAAFLGHYSLLRKNQLVLAYRVDIATAPRTSDEIVEVKLLTRDAAAQLPVVDAASVERVVSGAAIASAILPLAAWCLERR